MHIMEGFLPVEHAVGWTLASAPFVVWSVRAVRARLDEYPEQRMLLGVAAAFALVLSALKLPSVTGSCSHPTGIGLGALLFGPAAMVLVGLVVLVFQALLLAHGGLTTLGANVFSMAIVGSFVAAGVFRASRTFRLSLAGRSRHLRHHLGPTRLGVPRPRRRLRRLNGQVRRNLRPHPDSPRDHRRAAHGAGRQRADTLQRR